MQIVIDVPDSTYNDLRYAKQYNPRFLSDYEKIILSGTPLPKGHGDLIDRNEIKRKYKSDGNWNLHKAVDSMPTIIAADTESDQ